MVNSCESVFCQFSFAAGNLEFNVFTITKDFPIFQLYFQNYIKFRFGGIVPILVILVVVIWSLNNFILSSSFPLLGYAYHNFEGMMV